MPAIPSPRAGRRPRLEIIPFIDIMFFLLATFMMVSLSMIDIQGIDLNLPAQVPQNHKTKTTRHRRCPLPRAVSCFLTKSQSPYLICRKDSVSLSLAIRKHAWSCKATTIVRMDLSSKSSTAPGRED